MRAARPLPSYPDGPRPRLVAPVRADPAGRAGPTPNEARGPFWRRTSRGFYVPAEVTHDQPEQRILEAAVVVPEVAGVTGWAALRWCGAPWFDGLAEGGRALRPVTIVTADANVRSQNGIVVSQERLNPAELFLHDTLALTVPVRSACFEARYAPSLRAATEVWDMAAFSDLVALDEARAYVVAHPGWTGVPQARTALDLADENSWSPQETWLRLAWELEADLPRPRCNVPIFDASGRLIGTPDLFDPVRGVVGEYDGALHLARAQRARDLAREDMFRRHGLECVTILAEDLHQPGRAADRIRSTYQRARPVPAARRTWTISPPPWWRPTITVAQRRRLAAQGFDRLLRRRRVG